MSGFGLGLAQGFVSGSEQGQESVLGLGSGRHQEFVWGSHFGLSQGSFLSLGRV